MTAQPSVLVLHIRTERPHAPAFQTELDEMNDSAIAALREAGWNPALVAAAEVAPDDVCRLAREADAVLVMGGEDVDPSFYGGLTEYPGSGMHEPEADRVTFEVMRDAIAENRPLLAICRGHQQLNVALGGTLHEHMTGHSNEVDNDFVVTEMATVDDTTIARIGTAGESYCFHHQAVKDVAPGLRVTVRAADGTVEATEHESAPVASVQWHPEHPATASRQLVPLLQHLIDRAAR